MMIVGVLSTVSVVRGSVADAGFAAAVAGIGTAIFGPVSGALADRVGQRVVLLVFGVISILAVGGLLALLLSDAPLPLVLVAAFVLGGTTPQVAPFSRSRLVVLARRTGSPERNRQAESTVMSYESAVDELSFVIGPVLVGLLITLIAPWAPLALGAMLTATVVLAFAMHPTGARIPAHARVAHAPGRLVTGHLVALAAGMLLVGGIFGGILTSLTEFMDERGAGETTGIAYGAMSMGAILVALGVALLPEGVTLAMRWAAASIIAVIGTVTLLMAPSIPGVVVALFLSGCGVGAALVALFSLGAQIAPAGRATTVITTLQSTLVVGQALASAAGGLIAQQFGSTAGFGLVLVLAVLLAVLGGAHLLISRRATSTSA